MLCSQCELLLARVYQQFYYALIFCLVSIGFIGFDDFDGYLGGRG